MDRIRFEVPDRVFELLFETDPFDKKKGFLERYNFTIREDTPLEVEVAVDPEMLGKVYESLISGEERDRAGIFQVELPYRDIQSIFEELGLPKPNRDYSNIDANKVPLDKVMPDRMELDRIIFEVLGLTEEEQLEV